MNEREQQGKVRHLAVLRHAEEVSPNVAAPCQFYGMSRQTFYKWLSRLAIVGQRAIREQAVHERPQARAQPRVRPGPSEAERAARSVLMMVQPTEQRHSLLGPALPHPKLSQPAHRRLPHRDPLLEQIDRRAQLELRVLPPSRVDEDPCLVRPAVASNGEEVAAPDHAVGGGRAIAGLNPHRAFARMR